MAIVAQTSLNLNSIKNELVDLYKNFISKYESYLRYTRPKALQAGKISQVNVIDALANTLLKGFNKVFSVLGSKEFELGLPIVPLVIGGVVFISSTALLLYFRSKTKEFDSKLSLLEKDVLTPTERQTVLSSVFGQKGFFDLGLGKMGVPVLVIGILLIFYFLRR